MKRDPRQRLFPVSAAPSPCVRNCCLDEQDICRKPGTDHVFQTLDQKPLIR